MHAYAAYLCPALLRSFSIAANRQNAPVSTRTKVRTGNAIFNNRHLSQF